MTEYGRFYKTVPMVGTIPENSSGGGGTGLQTVVCGKVAAAGPDRIGGGGGLPCGVVGVATQSDADLLEEMRFTYETVCSEGYNDTDYTEDLDFEIEARGWEAAFAVAVAKLRQPTQSDALAAENERLREALAHIAFSGANGPYGEFGEALNEYQMRRVARAALQEQNK